MQKPETAHEISRFDQLPIDYLHKLTNLMFSESNSRYRNQDGRTRGKHIKQGIKCQRKQEKRVTVDADGVYRPCSK